MRRNGHHTAGVVCLLLCLAWLSSGCGFNGARSGDLNGSLLVWYTWPEPDSQLIESFLDSFDDLHPGVSIASEYVSPEELEERFIEDANAGLGPDLLIGAELPLVYQLIEDGLLAEISDLDTSGLLPHAVDALMLNGRTYGVPFAAYTNVLFYNRNTVERPPRYLDELLAEVRDDRSIAIPADFNHTLWGIRAHGDPILTETGTLEVGDALADWFGWLLMMQKEPTVFFNTDNREMIELFRQGRVDYLIAESTELPYLREALGEESVGLALLPTVRQEEEDAENTTDVPPDVVQMEPSMGALLDVESLVMSDVSAAKTVAGHLISFFLTQPHQRELAAAGLGQIPMNQRVRFDSRLAPEAATISRQASNTLIIPLAHVIRQEQIMEAGSEVTIGVLEGIIEPADAADELYAHLMDEE